MVNYQNGFIYKLCCKNTNIKDEYIGSSTNFTRRKCSHNQRCSNPNNEKYNLKVYKFIRDNGNFENWSMIEIEKYPCDSKRELETRERYFIELYESKLNSNIPTRTLKEWEDNNVDRIKEYRKERYNENKDSILEKQKERYNENKDSILEKQKAYYIKNKDSITEKHKAYYIKNKDNIIEYTKEYHNENRDKILEKQKEYYVENKDELNKHQKEKVVCECSSVVSRRGLASHRQTEKHKKLLEEKNKK